MSEQTRGLIADIERKDRRFRLAQGVFMVLVMLTLSVVLVAQFRILSGIQEQLNQQQQTTTELKKNTQDQLQRQTNYIRCLANYFGQTNRLELKITDIDKCLLERAGQATSDASPTSGAPIVVSPAQQTAPQTTAQPAQSTPQSSPPASTPPQRICTLNLFGLCL